MARRDPKLDEARRERCLTWLARYDELVGDRRAFDAALAEPPPVDLLVPGPADDVSSLRRSLTRRGERVESFPWSPRHLRVPSAGAPGELPEVALGLAYPQGVVSGLPPLALAPRAGDVVLDGCAAPGGKTIHSRAIADGPCRIFAGEVSRGRAGLLVQSLARHGVTSALVVRQDASTFPRVAPFDRILLDVPCTGEGTFRLPRMRFEPSGEEGLARAAAVQRRVLERGLELLAPGGRLVYATCTYAPEENEAVISDVIGNRPEIDVLPLPSGMPGRPGVHAWRGRRFDHRVERARRLTPADTGSWGFFVALLGKSPDAEAPRARRPDPRDTRLQHDPTLADEASSWLCERFGVPGEALDRWIVTGRGRDVWIADRLQDETSVDLGKLELIAPGMRAVRRGNRGARATTALLRRIGPQLTRHVVEVDDCGIEAMLARGDVEWRGLERGQVAVAWRGRVVSGAHASSGRLSLELPSAWR